MQHLQIRGIDEVETRSNFLYRIFQLLLYFNLIFFITDKKKKNTRILGIKKKKK